MDKKLLKTPYDRIIYQVNGCAMAVHRGLGPGLREDSYERALALKLSDAGIAFEQQKRYEVFDEQKCLIGYYIPDFVVEESIIVEIKALPGIDNSHLAQVIGYLAVSGCPIGLLINFGERSLHVRRVFPPTHVLETVINRQWLFVPDWLKHEKDHK
jgi:GxxExxY protein